MSKLLLTVGNIYVDHNIFNVRGGEGFTLASGKDYFGDNGERVLGGSAVNAAMQAKRLGLDVAFIGKTGGDEGAEEVKNLLRQQGIVADLMSQDDELISSMAVNLINTDGNFIGIHYGNASKSLVADDINLDHELFSRAEGIYFGGTAKQPDLFKNNTTLFKTISKRDIKIFYDPNRFPAEESEVDSELLMEQLAYAEGYFPNSDELLQATGLKTIDSALDKILETGVAFVALKLGVEGCRIKTVSQDFTVPGQKVTPKTTVGAGDCFNATFIAAYLSGLDLETCAKRATIAASIKVGKNIWPDEQMISG